MRWWICLNKPREDISNIFTSLSKKRTCANQLIMRVQAGFTSVHSLTFTCHSEVTVRITGRDYKHNQEKQPVLHIYTQSTFTQSCSSRSTLWTKSCRTYRKPQENANLNVSFFYLQFYKSVSLAKVTFHCFSFICVMRLTSHQRLPRLCNLTTINWYSFTESSRLSLYAVMIVLQHVCMYTCVFVCVCVFVLHAIGILFIRLHVEWM